MKEAHKKCLLGQPGDIARDILVIRSGRPVLTPYIDSWKSYKLVIPYWVVL